MLPFIAKTSKSVKADQTEWHNYKFIKSNLNNEFKRHVLFD